MLSQTVEYALRIAIRLAATNPEPQTADSLSVVTRVPRAYLSKVIQGLVRGGVVKSQRGVGGGVVLLKSPRELSILEIVNAVDPIARIKTCPLGIAAHGVKLCPLHKRVDAALAHVETAFGQSTLAELLEEPSESVPLCPFPRVKGRSVRVEG